MLSISILKIRESYFLIKLELLFFFINIGVRVSLHAPRLILWILKLTTI